MEADTTNDKKPAKQGKTTKAAFIRSLPIDLPAKEVLQKAKDSGFTVNEDYVHEVRAAMKKGTPKGKKAAPAKAKKAPAAKAKKPAPAPKKAKKAAPAPKAKAGAVTKAGFVRSMSTSVPAKEVVAAAAKLGLTMSPDYVHKVRSTTAAKARVTGAKPAPKPAPKKAPAAKTPAPKVAVPKNLPKLTGNEAAFRKAVLEIGLQRAKNLLADLDKRLASVVAGR